jgi:sugar/nucleoside kinase (ribokinase family)
MPFDILGLGAVAVDDLLTVPSYPAADSKVRVQRRERQCGGQCATTLVAAARLGARCAYAGLIGDDEDSRYVLDTFRREGVDTTHACCRSDARPFHSTIIVDEQRHTRTILAEERGRVGAAADWPSEDVLRATRVLYVDHHGIEGMTRAARIARQAGIPVVADLERGTAAGFAELLALVDHLIVSCDFAIAWTGEANAAPAVQQLWTPSRCVVAVTCGADGCFYREADGVVHEQPAFAVPAVDTTGCGDVFHGAYAAALVGAMSLAERMRFAAAAAALKATRPGGQAGIPDRAMVETFLAGTIRSTDTPVNSAKRSSR